MRTTLRFLGLDRGWLMEYARADGLAADTASSTRRAFAIATAASFAAATAAAIGVSAFVRIPALDALAACSLIAAGGGLVSGAAAWRRVGTDPFEALRRLAPIGDAAWAGTLERVELLVSHASKGFVWMACAAVAVASAWGALGPGLAAVGATLVLPPTIAAMSVVCWIAGSRASVGIASRRARARAGVGQALLALLRSGVAALTAWMAVALVLVPLLDTARVTFHSFALLIDAGAWRTYFALLDSQIAAGLAALAVASEGTWWAGAAGACAAVIVVGSCVLVTTTTAGLARLDRPEMPTQHRDVLDGALAAIGSRTARLGAYASVYRRRMHLHRGLLAQRFWGRVLPSPEASIHLGITGAFAAAAQDAGLTTMLLVIGIVFAVHAQTTELRAELAPISSLSADRSALPLLLQAPEAAGVRVAMQVREVVLRLQIIPSSVLVLIATAIVAIVAGVSPAGLLLLTITTVAVTLAAPLVQWFMGAALVAHALGARANEQWEDSAAAALQRRLQAVPRTWIAVVPAYAAVICVVLAGHVPPSVPWGIAAGTAVGHLLSVPLLTRASRAFDQRLQRRGLGALEVVR